jgi:hypothetical protein
MMIVEFIATIQRLEAAESSGRLSVSSLKQAAILWRNEFRGFKHWSAGAELIQAVSRLSSRSFVCRSTEKDSKILNVLFRIRLRHLESEEKSRIVTQRVAFRELVIASRKRTLN